MKLTESQFKTLSQFEAYFNTAVNSDWSRHPGQAALQMIHEIYTQVSGDRRKLNGSCQSCILHLLQDCGRLYFADKQERIDQENDRRAVEASKADLEVKRIAVKTKKVASNTKK